MKSFQECMQGIDPAKPIIDQLNERGVDVGDIETVTTATFEQLHALDMQRMGNGDYDAWVDEQAHRPGSDQ